MVVKWMWGRWDKPFFHEQSPSIDFLELYAVVVAIFAWTSNLANKHVVVFSDNTPTVAVINDKLASSPNLMHLIRFFVLHCMLNNITVQARYMYRANSTKFLMLCLVFSIQKFHELHPSAEDTPTPCPTFLYPLCGAHIQQLTTLAVAESTSKSYARGWCMFERFAEQYHVNMNSIKEHNLLEFISFLSLSGFAASTVQLYLTAVRHHLKLQGRNSFKDSFVIKMVVKGVSSRYSVPDIRLPINIGLLHDMWNILPIVVRNPYMVKLYRSMFTLAYHGLLRPGEVTYTPHAIKVEHVYFVYENVHLYLHSSKAKTGPFPQRVVVAPQPGICPVTDLHTYLQVRPCIPGALFRKGEWATCALP